MTSRDIDRRHEAQQIEDLDEPWILPHMGNRPNDALRTTTMDIDKFRRAEADVIRSLCPPCTGKCNQGRRCPAAEACTEIGADQRPSKRQRQPMTGVDVMWLAIGLLCCLALWALAITAAMPLIERAWQWVRALAG
ncbi:MAG: hypothetical protein RLZZ373_2644 [Pseudomonadota bacterium]|jgi:hypothetical protein